MRTQNEVPKFSVFSLSFRLSKIWVPPSVDGGSDSDARTWLEAQPTSAQSAATTLLQCRQYIAAQPQLHSLQLHLWIMPLQPPSDPTLLRALAALLAATPILTPTAIDIDESGWRRSVWEELGFGLWAAVTLRITATADPSPAAAATRPATYSYATLFAASSPTQCSWPRCDASTTALPRFIAGHATTAPPPSTSPTDPAPAPPRVPRVHIDIEGAVRLDLAGRYVDLKSTALHLWAPDPSAPAAEALAILTAATRALGARPRYALLAMLRSEGGARLATVNQVAEPVLLVPSALPGGSLALHRLPSARSLAERRALHSVLSPALGPALSAAPPLDALTSGGGPVAARAALEEDMGSALRALDSLPGGHWSPAEGPAASTSDPATPSLASFFDPIRVRLPSAIASLYGPTAYAALRTPPGEGEGAGPREGMAYCEAQRIAAKTELQLRLQSRHALQLQQRAGKGRPPAPPRFSQDAHGSTRPSMNGAKRAMAGAAEARLIAAADREEGVSSRRARDDPLPGAPPRAVGAPLTQPNKRGTSNGCSDLFCK